MTTAAQQTITVSLARPHAAQRRILREAARYNVAACGRRWGKSTLALELAVREMLAGKPVGYFAPTYKLLLEYWRAISVALAPVTRAVSQSERRIEIITGGSLECWTLTDGNAGRSRKYGRVIIDEAGLVADLGDTWQAAIRPTLADLRGDAWLLGTPKGRNFFWAAYQYGQDSTRATWRSWQMPTGANPHISPAEIAAMREELSERRYQQEIEAAFLEDSGGVFRNVRAAVGAVPPHDASHTYIIGVDWARSGDYTVLTVVDATAGAVVALDRFTGVEYAQQIGRLRALYERWRAASIIAEANSMGGPLIEQLRRERLPVRPFTTTNATKAAIIDGLALAFERGAIRLPDARWLVDELEAYEADRTASGLVRYGAPEGMHDDGVMSLAIAWYAASQPRARTLVDYL